jgi:hypothetical protein
VCVNSLCNTSGVDLPSSAARRGTWSRGSGAGRHCFCKPSGHPELALGLPQQQRAAIRGRVVLWRTGRWISWALILSLVQGVAAFACRSIAGHGRHRLVIGLLVARARQPNKRSHRIHQQPIPPRCVLSDRRRMPRRYSSLPLRSHSACLEGTALLRAMSQLCASPRVVITRRRDLAGGGALSRQHLAGQDES